MEATEPKTTTKHTLLEMFLDLKDEEFETFKWFLQNPIGFEKIPTGKLQNSNRWQTVDLMDQTYVGDSLKVTRTILTKIKRHDLLGNLTNCLPLAAASGTSHREGVKDLLPKFTPLMDPSGEQSLNPLNALRKYYCKLTVDMNTVHKSIKVSDNRTLTRVRERQTYREHPDRFGYYEQLLCREALPDRCYWEVEWSGRVDVAVSYRGINRKKTSDDCRFGGNDQSWMLFCYDKGSSVCHNKIRTDIPSSFPPASHRVAVYVDRPAGSVSFYEVSSDSLTLLHTFNTTFTEPLYAGFGFLPSSSVSLIDL